MGVTRSGAHVDDFTPHVLCPLETTDCYELVVERHRKTSTVITGDRGPSQWLGELSDSLLTQSRHGGCRRRRPPMSATSTPAIEVANSTPAIVPSCSLSIDRPGSTDPQASAADRTP